MVRRPWRDRWLGPALAASARHAPVTVLTGARRTGKTSLARRAFPAWTYRNLDSVTERLSLGRLPPERFGPDLGMRTILDEIQKAPRLLDKVKFAVDESTGARFVVTGSAQILLLRRVRETLAGRARLLELFPLGLGEAAGSAEPPLLARLLAGRGRPERELARREGSRPSPEILRARDESERWGGMPEVHALPESQRPAWLEDYVRTYLERDLADLARLDDITVFSDLQRVLSTQPAQILSLSGLARDCATSAPTVKRHLGYLSLSYQTFLLPPWTRRVRKRIVRSPKVYFTDVGILRSLSGHGGALNGHEHENWVVAEIWKALRTFRLGRDLHFYRSHAGLEADLVVPRGDDLLVFEIKRRDDADPGDARTLRRVRDDLGGRVVLLAVLTRGGAVRRIDDDVWQIPVEILLGP